MIKIKSKKSILEREDNKRKEYKEKKSIQSVCITLDFFSEQGKEF